MQKSPLSTCTSPSPYDIKLMVIFQTRLQVVDVFPNYRFPLLKGLFGFPSTSNNHQLIAVMLKTLDS